ncbi:hypothetical protein CLU79DRAFT_3478 [Phycomyces nitens]|nr:hypothetical protein CLU79DRAFT_3478 [Phycomyces nitens]
MKIPENTFSNYQYKKWVERTSTLNYFDFAKYCNLPEQQTNSHYASILRLLSEHGEKNDKKVSKEAHKLFSTRKGKTSSATSSTFYKQYNHFWKHDTDREDSEQESEPGPVNEEKVIMTRMRKRRLEAMESINDSIMEQLESDAKRVTLSTHVPFLSLL